MCTHAHIHVAELGCHVVQLTMLSGNGFELSKTYVGFGVNLGNTSHTLMKKLQRKSHRGRTGSEASAMRQNRGQHLIFVHILGCSLILQHISAQGYRYPFH